MNLEVNKNHKKIDVSNLKDPVKKVKLFLAGTAVLTSLYTGVLPDSNVYAGEYDSYAIEEEYGIDIPYSYQDAVCRACGKDINSINSYDLDSVTNLNLEISESGSLKFLDNCSNLKSLRLEFCNTNDVYCLDTIPYIPSLTDLTIVASEDLEISSEVNNKFIYNNCDNLKCLNLDGVSLGPNTIENFTNLDKVILSVSENNDLNYKDLKANELDLSWYGPYDIPIFLNRDDYSSLKKNGVNINFGSSYTEDKYLNVLKELENIADSLNINEHSTDQEKLDAIVSYALDNFEYDENVLEAVNNGNISNINLSDNFYKGGNLYAMFEKDTAICGNYTAFIKAMLHILKVDNFYVFSNTHAWNLVKVEDNIYYVDATVLDLEDGKYYSSTIKDGNGEELTWYMTETDSGYISEIDPSGDHDPVLFPKYMGAGITDLNEDLNVDEYLFQDLGNEEVGLDINGKHYTMAAGAFLGIMLAIGKAIPVRRKRKKEEQEKNVTPGYENYPYYYNYKPKNR